VSQKTDGAIEELREALLAAEVTDEWLIEDRQVFDLVQHSIVHWADDLGRALQKVNRALEAAEAHARNPDEELADELEEALLQIASAREKVVAITAQLLGVPSLVRHKKGVRFEPSESTVKNKLSEVGAGGQPQAGRLKSRLDVISAHPAIALRNQITHALSPLGNVVENCWIRKAYLDEKGGIGVWERGPLYPEGTLDQDDIQPQTIWEWATRSAREAYELLQEATTALARLTAGVGTIAPPQAVFIWPEGNVQFDRPKSDWLERGLTS
jgi:hypothetical protein